MAIMLVCHTKQLIEIGGIVLIEENVYELLLYLRKMNIKLKLKEDKLNISAPKDIITDELKKKISENKSEIISFLKKSPQKDDQQQLIHDEENKYKPFPLTDIQQAYFVGRNNDFKLGNVATHIYYEFENEGLHVENIQKAWQKLIERHDMLRAVINNDGTQQILKEVPEYKIKVLDLQDEKEERIKEKIEDIRNLLSHQVLDSSKWPLFDVRITLLPKNEVLLHVSIDLLIADGLSCQILLKELSYLYENPEADLGSIDLNFRDYVLYNESLKNGESYKSSLKYWQDRIADFPLAPELKLAKSIEDVEVPHFTRKTSVLEKDKWKKIKKLSQKYGVTPSMVLLTAYANVIKTWSKYSHFALNMTLFNRPNIHKDINKIIGDFTTLSLLEINLDKNVNFLEQVKTIQGRFWKDIDNRSVSAVKVIREIAKANGSSKGLNIPIVFTSELLSVDEDMFKVNYKGNTSENNPEIEISGIGKQVYGISQTPQVWIDHQVGERDGALTFNWDIVEELFDKDVIDSMFTSYCSLLNKIANDEEFWLDSEAELVNYETKTLPPDKIISVEDIKEKTLDSIFTDSAKKYPNNEAVVTKEVRISYEKLDIISNKIGNWLIAEGMQVNEPVAIVMDKGWEQIAAALGILKSSGAYVPISSDMPLERISYILKNGGIKYIITQSWVDSILSLKNEYKVMSVDKIDEMTLDDKNISIKKNPEDVAYIIYTSGSTGSPKGVMISHKAALNTIADINKRFGVKAEDRIFAISSLSFDLSVYDVFGAFEAGAGIIIPDKESSRNPAHWLDLLEREKVTVWNSVPALMEMLVEYVEGEKVKKLPSSLRVILLSGDWIAKKLVNRINNLSKKVKIISLGGATEAAIWSVFYPINNVSSKLNSIPYGCALSNQSIYVLDDTFNIRPAGVPGKIFIGGVGLAKGYWHDEEKTAESFMINPLTKERLYQTGDWGYYAEDGNIIFLGREDNQVKIGGFRIELGEIESAIAQFKGVNKVVAVSSGNNLAAYYDVVAGEEVNVDELKEAISLKLPSYMRPEVLMQIDKIPLTQNGKVNRKQLLKLANQEKTTENILPQTEVEKELVKILSTELDNDNIYANSNFFQVGGDSIAAIRILVIIRNKYNINLSAKDIFDSPIVSDLARNIETFINKSAIEETAEENTVEVKEEEAAIDVVLEKEIINEPAKELPQLKHDVENEFVPFPLTGLQQAYFVGRGDAVAFGNVACHTYEEIDVENLDIELFNRAWKMVIDRHDALRTIINNDGTQQILKDIPEYNMEVKDISEKSGKEKEEILLALRNEMSHKVMDITKWPLFELKATKIDESVTRLHIGIDAIIADAWSVGILCQEVCDLYDNINLPLEPIEITNRDYILGEEALKETEGYKEALDYWKNVMRDMKSAPDLPIVKDFSLIEQPKFKRRRKELDPKMWNKLKGNATKFGLTPAGIMLAAFAEVLTFWSNSSQFTLNVPYFNRLPLHRQVDDLIGEFASFFLMPIDNSANNTFLDRAKTIQSNLWQHMNHNLVSGVQLLREYSNMTNAAQTISMPIVYTSTIGLMDQDTSPFDGFGKVEYSISQTPQVWLDCQVGEKGNTVIFNWDAVEEIFPQGLLDDMFNAYCKLLNKLAYSEESWQKKNFDFLPDWQKEVFEDVNDTYQKRIPKLLHEQFAEQAVKNPENIAVCAEDKLLTYHDLYLYTDQIAQWLIDKGVKKGNLVAVAMEKGWEQIAAVLGILNSGAAFVPIDIDLPDERIKHLLARSEVNVVLTQSKLEDKIKLFNKFTICCVDEFALDKQKIPEINTIQEVDDLAYVLYTSGSTDTPKGVMISHRNVDNVIFHTNTNLKITAEDKALQITALHHDLSIYDIFGLLSAGGTLVIPKHSLRLDAEYLCDLINKEHVTFWNSVPSIMEMLVDYMKKTNKKFDKSFRQIILGGDWIPLNLVKNIKFLSDTVNILSIGGPTETTIWNIWYPIKEINPEWTSIPYGKPISNSKYYVLDEKLQETPMWVTGQLYAAGTQLSLGYWKDEEKTKDNFLIHPDTGERIYRTGDLGRYLPDGNIEFMGRDDFQVKLNGLRIELGEIEKNLEKMPNVRNAVATVIGENTKQLVAFVCLGDKSPKAELNSEINTKSIEEANVISDPFERFEFKQQKLGIRKPKDKISIKLSSTELSEEYKNKYILRRSYRYFIKKPIEFTKFSSLLNCLTSFNFENLPFPKYRYASAGGLYPVQIYIYVKPERVEGVAGGYYYFKPDTNELIKLKDDSEFDANLFPPGNREIFEEAAYTLFLIGNLDAIKPMYGPLTDRFCYIEAGIISQMLDNSAIENGLGFCQIGNVEFDALREKFVLDDRYKYLHCMIGGEIDNSKDKYQALIDDMSGYKIMEKSTEDENDYLEVLKESLAAKLPAYMVPAKIILLDELPITANGKVDRKVLKNYVDLDSDRDSAYVEPKTDVEKKLVELIEEVLDIDKVGVNDNLFKLGGDSLIAIRLSSQIRNVFQVEVTLKDLFNASTIGKLADQIVSLGGTINEDTEVVSEFDELPVLVEDLENRYEPFPLTDVQQAYWIGRNSFIELGNVSTHVYLEIEERGMDIHRFEEVWQTIINRHEMLRTIIRDDGQQQILKEVPYYNIELINLKSSSKEEREIELNKIRDEMSHEILKADEWPLFDIKASLLEENKLRLHVSIDLLISDVWSSRIVTREVMALYNNSQELKPLNLSFRDYVLTEQTLENTKLYKKSWDYWMERIKTLPKAPELPLVKNPGSLTKPKFERRVTTIDKYYWDKLKTRANKLGVTHSGLLAAAYSEILARWSKSPHFTLNLTLFNRLPFSSDVNDIVGDFTSLILLEVDDSKKDTFEDRVKRLQQQILEDMDHRYVSGIKVIRELSKQEKGGPRATMPVVFTSTLNLGSTEYPSGSLDDGDDVYGISQTPQIWLDHVVSEQNGNLVMNWDAVEELFPKGMLDDMFASYCNLLYRLAEDESAWKLSINELVLLPESQIKARDIESRLEEPDHNKTLNGLFNSRAAEQPENIAVITSNKLLTYRELSELSNKLGRLIRANNESKLVAIIMDKGWEQVVAAMAVLQAGYAYLPISADMPRERIKYLLKNSEVEVVLTQSWLKDKVKVEESLKIFAVDEVENFADYSGETIDIAVDPNKIAYIIYTSGSTGLPKGVIINHKGAVNTILDVNRKFGVTNKDRVLSLSELNFDLSVYDIFGMLAAGGIIVIPDADKRKDPGHWLEMINNEHITVWNSVPTFMSMLVEYVNGSQETLTDSLRLILLSGDWIPVELPSMIRKITQNPKIISLGGATEASIWSIYYEIGEVDKEKMNSIPYGKALAGQQVYILDDNLGIRPDFVPGKIYISGVGLADGYWHDEEKTKERFVINYITLVI